LFPLSGPACTPPVPLYLSSVFHSALLEGAGVRHEPSSMEFHGVPPSCVRWMCNEGASRASHNMTQPKWFSF
jgi:hypothetical protein